jgi:membrane protease YdiL (CAAX protease family)
MYSTGITQRPVAELAEATGCCVIPTIIKKGKITMNTPINEPLSTAFVWNWRLFALLWLLGFAGVLTLLLMPIPLPTGNMQLPSPAIIRLLQLVQTSVLLSLSVAVGCWAAPRLGLQAPLIAAWAEGRTVGAQIGAILMSSLLMGVLGGILATSISLLAQPYLPAALTDPNSAANSQPLLVRFLYGGILEEILLRWGLMSAIAWGLWRLLQGGVGLPSSTVMWIAILGAALLFGFGHLPMAFSLAGSPTPFLLIYIVGLNALLALLFGWLYWQKGLEAAMLAHMAVHVVFVSANLLLLRG